MTNFTRGLLIGGLVGATLGLAGMMNSDWVQRNVWKPSKKAIKRASRVMNDAADMI